MSQLSAPTPGRLSGGLLDSYTATLRFLIRGRRQPDVIFGSILIPVIFVVLFGYVFGSSISIPGENYRSYLMPGLFALAILFNIVAIVTPICVRLYSHSTR